MRALDLAQTITSFLGMNIYNKRFTRKIPFEKAKKFIEVYEKTHSAAVASKIVGLRLIHVRRYLALDPSFDEAYRIMNDVAKDSLQGVLMDRVVKGENMVAEIE